MKASRQQVEEQIRTAELRIEWAKNTKVKILASNMPTTQQFEQIRLVNNTILFCEEQLEALWAKRAALAKQEALIQ